MNSLPPAVPGDRFEIVSDAGRLNFYVAGSGPPLLLVHSVNAAASAAEVRPLFEHYRASRTVYALDLPGFGLSDRSDRAYTPRLMTDAIHAAAEAIRTRTPGPASASSRGTLDALALSLSCEFLARAAVEKPGVFRSLALVSPTGFSGRGSLRAAPGSTRFQPWLLALLRGPGWGGGLFRLLTRPSVVRYFLARTWGSPRIDETLWAYCVRTARAPGAEHAPLHFLSGALFSTDIHNIYEQLTIPVWMSHGVRGDFTDYRNAALVADRPNWHFTEFPTGAIPYFEVTADFTERWDDFRTGADGDPTERSP